jgi:hypothetical protein
MASDGPTPPPCDPEVFRFGELMLITDTVPSNAMEQWVRKVAERSGQRVDWHFAGGRACVVALGDLRAVCAAIEELKPELDQVRERAIAALYGKDVAL